MSTILSTEITRSYRLAIIVVAGNGKETAFSSSNDAVYYLLEEQLKKDFIEAEKAQEKADKLDNWFGWLRPNNLVSYDDIASAGLKIAGKEVVDTALEGVSTLKNANDAHEIVTSVPQQHMMNIYYAATGQEDKITMPKLTRGGLYAAGIHSYGDYVNHCKWRAGDYETYSLTENFPNIEDWPSLTPEKQDHALRMMFSTDDLFYATGISGTSTAKGIK